MNNQQNIRYQEFIEKIILSKETLSNYTLSNKFIISIDKNENLFLEDGQNWILLVRDINFWRLYFSFSTRNLETFLKKLQDQTAFIKIKTQSQSIICEYISRKQESKTINCFLESLGFVFFIKRERFRLQKANLAEEGHFHSIRFANLSEASDILKQYHQTFDPYSSLMPTLDELQQSISAHRVLVLENPQIHAIKGFLEYDIETQSSSIIKFLIYPEYQGKGNANILLNYYIKEIVQKNHYRAMLWVKSDNFIAKSLYLKHGYKPDSYMSICYVKGAENDTE